MICDFSCSGMPGADRGGLAARAQVLTVRYASPEVLRDTSDRTLASDVWAFGCLVYWVRLSSYPAGEEVLA